MIFKLKITKKQRLFTIIAGFTMSLFFLIALLLVRVSSNELGTLDPFENLDNVMRDRFFAKRNSDLNKKIFNNAPDSFFIIDIDENSLSQIGRWPWDRRIMAKMLERLGKAGAKVVGVDIIFTEPAANPEEDIALLKAFAKYDCIILGLIHGFNAAGEMYVKRPLNSLIAKMYPPEEQKKLFSRMGFVGIDPDSDGIVRETPLLAPLKEGGTYLYSLGILMAAKYMNMPLDKIKPNPADLTISFGNIEIPVSTDKNLMTINYAVIVPKKNATIFKLSKKKSAGAKIEKESENNGDDASEKPLFFSDIISFYEASQLSDEEFTDAFKDKIVVIGATAFALGDKQATPLGVKLPGCWINANIAASILEGKFIKKSHSTVNALIIIAMGIISGLILCLVSPLPGVIFLLAAAITFFLGIRHQFIVNSILYPVATPEISLLFSFLAANIYQYRFQEREKRKIKSLFGGYLSAKVIDTLMDLETKGKLGLAGKKEKVTIFYSDIRGFTSLSEKLQPEEVVELLNDYFEKMSVIAIKYDAYIDKFIGDCMMAVFSAPVPRKDDAERAVKMAWEQQMEIDKIMEKYKGEGKPVFSVGMGINTGDVILGNIGSKHKMDYTVIGDNVNLAARLYANAKGGQILISQSTYEEVKHILEVNKLEPIMVRGKSQPVDIYEITGIKE